MAIPKRDQGKILSSEEIHEVELSSLDFEQIKTNLQTGQLKGICILGGGTNLKVTQDALVCEAVAKIAPKDVLCLTYGNTAVTLGRYGYLSGKSPMIKCIGTELDVVTLLDLVESIGTEKVIALFPELTTPRDVIVALALAGVGVKVLTAIDLPVGGSEEVAQKIGALITTCAPSEYVNQGLTLLEL